MATDDTTGTTELVVPIDEETEVAIEVPATATESECAALASAIGAHLSDRQRAAAAADEAAETVDRWKLAGRLKTRDSNRLPRRVRRGEEWKAAGRTRL